MCACVISVCVCVCVMCVPVCVQLLQQLFGISLRLSWHCNKDEHKLLTRFLAQEINASATLQAEKHDGGGWGTG